MFRRLIKFDLENKYLEAERLERRTKYDLAMLKEVGYCHGIENYSRHLSGRMTGEPPSTLLDYFPKEYLTVIDESHVTVPQIRGMFKGDASRKKTLIKYGFRLPSAMDNRPLNFHEFQSKLGMVIYTSATPGAYEKRISHNIVEQIIRPTGLVDPKITVRPARGQVEHLITMIKGRIIKNERVLVTTLTKRMAEDLSAYFHDLKMKVSYIHSDVKTLDRIKILTSLRRGDYDVVVGVNLLREGLDLPEVSLVAILDADKEGFLRNDTSLIQTIGRAARNANGEVLIYADHMTGSINKAIGETERRRKIQLKYNTIHHITPRSVFKEIKDILPRAAVSVLGIESFGKLASDLSGLLKDKESEMKKAANQLDFELAAILRDEIKVIRKKMVERDKKTVKI